MNVLSYLLVAVLLNACSTTSRDIASIPKRVKNNLGDFSALNGLDSLDSKNNIHLSKSQKREIIRQLDACSNNCENLALENLKKISLSSPMLLLRINNHASSTLLYFYSAPAIESAAVQEERNYLRKELLPKSDMNLIAYPLNATEGNKRSTKNDFQLDAELALKLAHALGLPITVQGNSFGGLLAAFLGSHYPTMIDKLVLISPALLLQASKNAMLEPTIPEFRKSFSHASDREDDDETDGLAADPYAIAMEEIVDWSKSILPKTMLIYSESDDILDSQALHTFADHLPNRQVIVFPKTQQISHLGTFREEHARDEADSSYESILRFLKQ